MDAARVKEIMNYPFKFVRCERENICGWCMIMETLENGEVLVRTDFGDQHPVPKSCIHEKWE